MDQVLFWIPIHTAWTPQGIPIYGFGLMLFLAFIAGNFVASRLARRIGVAPEKLQDLLIWVFVFGLVGGRLLYFWVEQAPERRTLAGFFEIWNGGIVFYGGAIGGAIGGVLFYRRLMKPFGVSPWQVADVIAPGVAIGLCLGRLGCFLNGCCYGYVAPPEAIAVHFPSLTAPARDQLVSEQGRQTLLGFSMDDHAKDDRTVGIVAAGSAAQASGLKPGDVIVAVRPGGDEEFREVHDYKALYPMLGDWPRGEERIALRVRRGAQTIDLPAFEPRLIGLYPTQVYESISAFLLFLGLCALYPLRKYDGQVIAWLMLAYAVHRYVNESLRDDTERFLWFTLSQWISFGIFAGGLLIVLTRRRTARIATSPASPT